MAAPPTSTKTSLQQRLSARARQRWPQRADVEVRFRGAFAYVIANMPDGDSMPLMGLRYGGSAARWGFAVYLASKDGYQDSVLRTDDLAGAPEDALDTACGLYLARPPGHDPPTNSRSRPLSSVHLDLRGTHARGGNRQTPQGTVGLKSVGTIADCTT
jgi:hypothetical protein